MQKELDEIAANRAVIDIIKKQREELRNDIEPLKNRYYELGQEMARLNNLNSAIRQATGRKEND